MCETSGIASHLHGISPTKIGYLVSQNDELSKNRDIVAMFRLGVYSINIIPGIPQKWRSLA